MARPQSVNPCLVSTAAELLALGHLVAFPTETVYGLGADGLNPKAVAKIFAAKGRPADHPVILHVADIEKAKSLTAQWSAIADRLAQAFWPGPMTLILKRAAHVPDAVTGGQASVGVRIPSHPVALTLLREFSEIGSGVIAAPSANRFGAISPTRAIDVANSIGDRLGPHDLILDGGDCQVGVESTIVDLTGDSPRILRPGGIGRQAIERVIGEMAAVVGNVPRVSGALASHYAPSAKTLLIAGSQVAQAIQDLCNEQPTLKIGGLLIHAVLPLALAQQSRLTVKTMSSDPAVYAHDLYAALNDLDQQHLDLIVIEAPANTPDWEAVLDRLKRATYSSSS